MKLWRVEILLRGPTLSDWQADTLWGHLCWILLHQRGEGALREWLGRYRAGEPPLLLSDGFPGLALPKPLFPEPVSPAPGDSASEVNMKRLKRARWLSRADFQASVAAGRVVLRREPADWCLRPAWRNTVSRQTGSSLAERDTGGLFVHQERWAPERRVSLYARTASEGDRALAAELFEGLRDVGYGKRRSIGYGTLEALAWYPEEELDRPPEGTNGFVSLSGFIPRQQDPTRGAWGLRVKHPRFSDEMPGSPLKQPLLFLTRGSTFYDQSPRPFYGGLVEGIALRLPEDPRDPRAQAVQYAYAFPLPACLPVSHGEERSS